MPLVTQNIRQFFCTPKWQLSTALLLSRVRD